MKNKLNKILNIPNLISFLRIILCFPLIKFLEQIPGRLYYQDLEKYSSQLYIILIIIILMVITDVLDGMAARWLNSVTDFGKLIDPIADKISILIVLVYLTQKPGIEGLSILIFFILLVCRDFYISLYAIYFIKKHNISFDSIKSGKWFVGTTVLMFLFFIYDPVLIKFAYFKWYFYGITLLLMFYSTYEYYARYIKVYKNVK